MLLFTRMPMSMTSMTRVPTPLTAIRRTHARTFHSTPVHALAKKNASHHVRTAGDADPATDAHTFHLEKFTDRMEKSVDKLRQTVGAFRLGRATTALLDGVRVMVEAGGPHVKLDAVGHVVVRDAQTLQVVCADAKSAHAVDKAIRNAGLGLNPQLLDGNIVRVPVPKMSTDQRTALTKQLAKHAEDTRGHIRQHRHDARKRLPKELPAAEAKRVEREIQTEHDRWMKEVDRVVAQKTKDLQAA